MPKNKSCSVLWFLQYFYGYWFLPIYKNGRKEDKANYHPVSVLSNISKIFEKAVFNRFRDYLDANYELDRAPNGFRSGKSVIIAATDFVKSIIDSIDKGEKKIGDCLAISKIFDSVEYCILCNKLLVSGIKGTHLNKNNHIYHLETIRTQKSPMLQKNTKTKYPIPV